MAKTVNANPTGRVEMLYNPYQQAYLQARRLRLDDGKTRAFHRYLLIAGRRGGKTYIGAQGVCEELSTPTWHGQPPRWWAVAPTYEELYDYVIPTFFGMVPHAWIPRGGWSELHKTLTLKNGAQLQFRSGEDPDRMRGPGLDGLWFDEARKIRKLAWDTARPMLTERRGVALFTTSPAGFDWVYKTLWVPANPGPKQRPGFWATRYRTIDNPAIPKEEVDEARATMDPVFFAQEYEAEFVSFEGAIYGASIEPQIIIDEAKIRELFPNWPEIPTTIPVIIGMDMGTDHPFAAVKIAVTPIGLVCCGEYRKRASAFHEHAAALKTLAGAHATTFGADLRWTMDRTAIQAQIELAQHGVMASGAENSVTAGIQRVQSWLRAGQLWFIESAVPLLIEEMRTYHWRESLDKKGEKRPEAPFKFDEDLCDGLRYGVMSWPELPQIVIPNLGRQAKDVPGDSKWAWERMQEINKREKSLEEGYDWDRDLEPGTGTLGDMFVN